MFYDGRKTGTEADGENDDGLGMSIDPRELRNAFGCFATGVTIITTTDSAGAPVGLTANSFSSLSLDPPLVLFCLDLNSSSFEAFHRNRHFVVNVLRDDQQELSSRFAKSGVDKWNDVGFETWVTGCPVLGDCIANLECEVDSVFEGGDHVIFVGKVVRLRYENGDYRPLLFFRGRYGQIDLDAG